MNLRPLRLDEVSFSHFVGKSEVAVAAYWNGEKGFENRYTSSEEAFASEEDFTASELYQELKTKAFQDLQRTLEHRFKVVTPLIQETRSNQVESKVRLSLITLNEKRWIEYSIGGIIDCLIEVNEISTVYLSKGGVGNGSQHPGVGAGRAYYNFSNKFTVEEIKSLMESKEPTSIEK